MIPQYFVLQEYVSQQAFETVEHWKLWGLLDNRILITNDLLRRRFGRIRVNNWHVGGSIHAAGLRLPFDNDYSLTSQHSHGRATDDIFLDVETADVRDDILKNPWRKEYEYISAVELDVDWLHLDCRYHQSHNRIFTFSPG